MKIRIVFCIFLVQLFFNNNSLYATNDNNFCFFKFQIYLENDNPDSNLFIDYTAEFVTKNSDFVGYWHWRSTKYRNIFYAKEILIESDPNCTISRNKLKIILKELIIFEPLLKLNGTMKYEIYDKMISEEEYQSLW